MGLEAGIGLFFSCKLYHRLHQFTLPCLKGRRLPRSPRLNENAKLRRGILREGACMLHLLRPGTQVSGYASVQVVLGGFRSCGLAHMGCADGKADEPAADLSRPSCRPRARCVSCPSTDPMSGSNCVNLATCRGWGRFDELGGGPRCTPKRLKLGVPRGIM